MDRQKLRAQLDEGLARAQAELEDLPVDFSEENWRRQQSILSRMRGLAEMKALFATPRREPDPEEKVWREMLY